MNPADFYIPEDHQTTFEKAVAAFITSNNEAKTVVAPLLKLVMKHYAAARANNTFFLALDFNIHVFTWSYLDLLWAEFILMTETDIIQTLNTVSGLQGVLSDCTLAAPLARLLVALISMGDKGFLINAFAEWHKTDSVTNALKEAGIREISIGSRTFTFSRDIVLFLDVIDMSCVYDAMAQASHNKPESSNAHVLASSAALQAAYSEHMYDASTRQAARLGRTEPLPVRASSTASIVLSPPAPLPTMTSSAVAWSAAADSVAALPLKDAAPKNECLICMDSSPEQVAVPCGHLALCTTCVKSEKPCACPLCGVPVLMWQKVFFI